MSASGRERTPRLAPLDAEAARTAGADVGLDEAYTELEIFRVLLREPRLARSVERLLTQLLFRNRLDAHLRELAIMRIAWLTGSVYEWSQHWRVATDLGMTAEELLGARDPASCPTFGPVERAVLRATDETVLAGRIGDATWAECTGLLDEDSLLELVVAVGWWRMIASVLVTLEVPLEPGVEAWPPDGVAPPEVRGV